MAKAGKKVFVEVDEIVEAGQINPEQVHLQGIYVDAIIQSSHHHHHKSSDHHRTFPISTVISPEKERILKRALKELTSDIRYVSLGMGFSQYLVDYFYRDHQDQHQDQDIWFYNETGVLGISRTAHLSTGGYDDNDTKKKSNEDINPNIVNSNEKIVITRSGASIFNTNEAFSMLRGGRIDISFLGAMQVIHYPFLISLLFISHSYNDIDC
jgi:3-oxoacid CoA-transferase